ncbi:MAG TPA: YIP1 family protein [Longimicrobiales bacterium]|nr:YIP1 family protein [Longimicrobiales bacterium]
MSTETQAAVAPAEKSSRWEDFIDVIFSPGQLFERRAAESWVKPFLIFCAVQVALYYLLLPVTGSMMELAMIENAPPEANAAQIQQSAGFMKWLMGVFAPIMFLLMVAGTGLAIKLVSSLLEPGASWRQSFVIATFAFYITVLQSLVVGIAVFIKSLTGAALKTGDASFGLLRFMDVGNDPVMRALLGRTDLFAIWSAVLIGIGLIHIVRMPTTKAFITAAIVWALIALPTLAMAALGR